MTKPLCIYHANCADGFASAWVVRKFFGDGNVDFHAAEYGKPLPKEIFDRDVYIVDFSYGPDELALISRHAKSVTVLDHHKTAMHLLDYDVAKSPSIAHGIQAVFDLKRSGAGITWDFFFPGKERPLLIDMVEDRDLWRFKLGGSAILHAAMMSYPWDFYEWDRFDMILNDKLNPANYYALLAEGAAIERRLNQDIETLLEVGTFEAHIGGVLVRCCNLPFMMASNGAGILAEGWPFGASYYDTADARVWSLRTRGALASNVDVSAIAKDYGGGGHAPAAGFKSALDWRGDK